MKDRITVVLQSFGGDIEYRRAILCIWSFYARIQKNHSAMPTLLFTDAPQFFQPYLAGLPVEYIPLTAEKLKAMRGEINFLHRIKISIIEEAFARTQGKVLYLDGDTFFVGDPAPFMEEISPDVSFMHEPEYRFETLGALPRPSGDSFHTVLRFLKEKEFVLRVGPNVKFDPSLYSWNAGVLMLDYSHRLLLPDVYSITEQLYTATGNHASEQFAFSLVLQTRTNIRTCAPAIYHYWYRVRKRVADGFLARYLTPKWTSMRPDDKRIEVLKWTSFLPGYFDRHTLMLRDNAIQSFNSNEFRKGYYWAARVLLRDPFQIGFFRDIAYHTRRFLFFKT